MHDEIITIYNLYPRLAGKFSNWLPHIKRAAEMKFTWIYLNPVWYPGFSGSIYSIKDYYKFDPQLIDESSDVPAETQFQNVIKEMHKHGLKVMVDLVINHTAIDSPLTKEHPDWYKKDDRGKIKHPVVKNGDKIVTVWGDLAEIDNENSPDKEDLWKYWRDFVGNLIELGVDGFRCDAAYQVPVDLWKNIINFARERSFNIKFFAETLGCTIKDVVKLGKAGFDYTFNSSKWWNFTDKWCLDQYHENENVSKSISFPESHDTDRLAKEYNDDIERIKSRYLFSAIYSAGVMMPMGFEYGFHKKIDVVKTSFKDMEKPRFDLTDFIKKANELKWKYQIFREESHIEKLNCENPNVLLLKKISKNWKEKVLIILNKDSKNYQYCGIKSLHELFQSSFLIKDISLSYALDYLPDNFEYYLRPSQFILLYQYDM